MEKPLIIIKALLRHFPGSSVVKTPLLPMQGSQVQSPGWEGPHATQWGRKKKKKRPFLGTLVVSFDPSQLPESNWCCPHGSDHLLLSLSLLLTAMIPHNSPWSIYVYLCFYFKDEKSRPLAKWLVAYDRFRMWPSVYQTPKPTPCQPCQMACFTVKVPRGKGTPLQSNR